MLNRLSIRAKLTMLAGVPVLGALVLASLLWMHAQRAEQSAAALGSVEDLAELSVAITSLVQELQTERALAALVLGYEQKAASNDPLELEGAEQAKGLARQPRTALERQRLATDAARDYLAGFLSGKDLSALPARLRRGIQDSQKELARLSEIRSDTDTAELALSEHVDYFAGANRDLIEATAALTQLSDDGDLLRSISALVSVMQVKERSSQAHALLASVFALGKFPPGTYRSFVGLTTEEEVYVDVLRSTAAEADVELYESSRGSAESQRAAVMRKSALENVDEEVNADATEWFRVQAAGVAALRQLEVQLSAEVRAAAASKLADIEASRRTSLGLSGFALLISTVLAGLIGRGIAGSVSALTGAAAAVQRDNDFSVRAAKTSDDELGQLTTAFNAMLGGIQARDLELDEYRRELETKVQVRTKELSERNAAMRLVLDNVDQGLATIKPDGTLENERSAAFDRWFGVPSADVTFGGHLAKRDSAARDLMDLAWGEVVEGYLPLELTVGQLPGRLNVDDRQYTLGYKPILGHDGQFEGALLVVTDVTEEEARRKREAEQAERIAIFEAMAQDRTEFVRFYEECERLLASVSDPSRSREQIMRDIHTLKGNCATHAIHSVAEACHAVETRLSELAKLDLDEVEPIFRTWADFARTAKPLIGSGDGVVAVRSSTVNALIDAVRAGRSRVELEAALERLKLEPVSDCFFRVGEQAKRIARRLGKPEPQIVSEPNDVRLPTDEWREFWSAFAHVINNAVDHGLESEKERRAAGKPSTGTLTIVASETRTGVRIELRDDGRGIDWDEVRQSAHKQGVPATTQAELVAALFVDALTTKSRVTSTSGRGVGLAAVRSATEALGGKISVESALGKGTTFRFDFPKVVSGEVASARSAALSHGGG